MLNVTGGTLKASTVKWLIRCAFDLPEWKCIGPVVSSIVQTWTGLWARDIWCTVGKCHRNEMYSLNYESYLNYFQVWFGKLFCFCIICDVVARFGHVWYIVTEQKETLTYSSELLLSMSIFRELDRRMEVS